MRLKMETAHTHTQKKKKKKGVGVRMGERKRLWCTEDHVQECRAVSPLEEERHRGLSKRHLQAACTLFQGESPVFFASLFSSCEVLLLDTFAIKCDMRKEPERVIRYNIRREFKRDHIKKQIALLVPSNSSLTTQHPDPKTANKECH